MAQWTSYLITDGLVPAEQLSTDDFAGTLANQTDLAIKAIVGIGAMGELASHTGHKTNATYYRDVSREYIDKWIEMAVSKDGGHTKLAYQDDKSWGTLYNMYGVRRGSFCRSAGSGAEQFRSQDRLLNLDLVPHRIYDMQSSFYFTVANEYGVPLDSRHTVRGAVSLDFSRRLANSRILPQWSKTDWQMFTAASATSVSARDLFTKGLVKYLKANVVNSPFPECVRRCFNPDHLTTVLRSLYETKSANYPGRDEGSPWRIEFQCRPGA